MIAEIRPGMAEGTVRIPASKSVAHRLLIVSALTPGKHEIRNLPLNEDILATIDCLHALGAQIRLEETTAHVIGINAKALRELPESELHFPCRESGSTLRFLIPLGWLTGKKCVYTGAGRLFSRPLSVYRQIAEKNGFVWQEEQDKLITQGMMTAGDYAFPGNISSQFVTGMILALIHLGKQSSITLTTQAESTSYVDLTLDAIRMLGYPAGKQDDRHYVIPGIASTCTTEDEAVLEVPGDHSGAAFFGALDCLSGKLTLCGIDENSLQGDRVWKPYFERLKAGNTTLDITDCPDLGPILMVVAALYHGGTLTGTARLKLKESDRGAVMAEELKKCGIETLVEENRIMIGNSPAKPVETLSAHNDHRIAMSLAVLCTRVGGSISGAESVKKSMPEFWDLLQSLGIEIIKTEEE